MTDLTERLSAPLADRYRIERKLGEGGMATVYLAHDLKHDRKVALKVLRPELAAVLGADRFVQEIKTTAQLQHPHILPLYDSGNVVPAQGGNTEFLYYVMPYIQGETLREKLNRDVQLGIDEAVKITTEVADALQYAHEQGVIHRDIKPENILLQNGRAMVADFGIALAVSAAAGGRMTETGLSLGTPHYMSPEQATADKHITNRSDVYSLGSVLYEMLTGEAPHTGSSAQAIIMKIVTDDVRPVRELRKAVPAHVAAAVAQAVQKLPADRFESAKAFADALRNPSFAGAVAHADARAASASHRYLVPALTAALIVTAALATWAWMRPAPTRPVARYTSTLGMSGAPDGMTLRVETALSPDGSLLVFRHPLRGPGQLFIKRRDEVSARPLAGTEGGSGPFFSPDGTWLGFIANGELRKIPINGGASLKLAANVDPTYNQGAWLSDGSIVYYDVAAHSLLHLKSGEAKPRVIVAPEKLGGRFPWLPSPLPDARGILFTAHQTNCVGPVSCRPSRVYVYDASADSSRLLFEDAVGAWYVSTGHVLYLTSGGTLMAAAWDNSALAATGKPVAILDGIQAPGLVVSNDGTAIYLLGRPEFAPGPVANAALVWVDRSGRAEAVDTSWQVNTGGSYGEGDIEVGWGVSLSPDGQRIAFTQLTELGTDIWLKPLAGGPVTRLTLDAADDRAPAFTSDGRAITFLSDRASTPQATRRAGVFGLWEQSLDGTGEPHLVWGKDAPTDAFTSADGRWLVMGASATAAASSGGDILAVQRGVDSTARRIIGSNFNERGAVLSPDARWLAYVSNEQGTPEVFVRPFPDVNAGRWQVSSGGGSAPVWAHSGRELFYVKGRTMYTVRINPGATFSADPPRVLFPVPDRVRAGSLMRGTFAITPDDQRFLMVRDNSWDDMAGTPTVVVVENFFDELRAKLKK
jgi:serine/threonine-protein kinase